MISEQGDDGVSPVVHLPPGHLGEVGQELYEVFDSDHEEDTEQAVKKLKSEVEPDVGASGSGGDKGGGGDDDEPIPIAPAVTGELK